MSEDPNAFEIRVAKVDEILVIESLFDRCFPPNDLTVYGRLPTEVSDGVHAGLVLVALDRAGQIVGFCQWCEPVGSTVHLEAIGVDSSCRGLGVATRLIAETLRQCRQRRRTGLEFSMTVSPTNAAMLRAATTSGFSATELYEGYFGTGADRLYLRTVPSRSVLVSDQFTFIPLDNTELMTRLVGAQSHVLVGFEDLPQGLCYSLRSVHHIDVSGPMANESSASIGVAAVLIGAMSFLFGLGLVDKGYPGDVLVVIGLGFLCSVGAMLVYGKAPAHISRIQRGEAIGQLAIGNILSEVGGYYSLFHIVPVGFAHSTEHEWLGLVLALIAYGGLTAYHRTKFEMLERYEMPVWLKICIETALAASPTIGVGCLIVFGSTTWWSFGDVVLLIAVMCVMFTSRSRSAHA